MRPASEPWEWFVSAVTWAVAALLCSAVPCQLPQGSSCFRTGLWWRGWEGAQAVSASLHMVASITHARTGGLQLGLPVWFAAVSAVCSETSDYSEVWQLRGSGRTWGIHPGLAEWQKMCFLATLKVSWLAYKRGKDSDMNCWKEKEDSLSERPDVPFKRLSPWAQSWWCWDPDFADFNSTREQCQVSSCSCQFPFRRGW